MINNLLRVLLIGAVLLSGLGCAAKRPVLYPYAQLHGACSWPPSRISMTASRKPPRQDIPTTQAATLQSLLPWEPQPEPRWAQPRAQWPVGPARARPWAQPGAAPGA